MSTNSDLQQINVFSKGMNTDTSDAFLSSEQYRYAENLRFVAEKGTEESTGGELSTIEGWDLKYHLDIDILKVSSIRNYIIIIGRKDGGWGIWSIDTESESEFKRHFGPCTSDIGNNLSVVTRWESNNNIKVYIADGLHQIMSLNIARDKHRNIKDYGTDIKSITGNLEITLKQLTAIQIENSQSRLTAPVLQYAYILYKIGGQSSALSPLTRPIVLYKDDGGYYYNEVIKSAVELSLDDIDTTKVDRIKIYRIAYVQNGQDPDIALIYDDAVTSSFSYIDSGFDIMKVTAAEFISINNIILRPLLIESKNDYLFAANVQYDQQEIDDKFKNCTAWYEPVLAEPYDLDFNNNVSEGQQYKASFRRGETYRFGIVFYDKQGNKSSVILKTIKDVTIPGIEEESLYTEIYTITNGDTKKCTAHPYKVLAHINNIPEDCSGFELVRCKRGISDTVNICQGILGRAQQISDQTKRRNLRFMFPYMTMDKYISITNTPAGSNMESCSDCLMFASPEYVYQADDIKQVLNNYKSNIKLQTISKFKVPTRTGGTVRIPKIIHDDDKGYYYYQGSIALGDGTIISTYPGSNLDPGEHPNRESGCTLRWNESESCYETKYGSCYYEGDNVLQCIREISSDYGTENVVFMAKLYPHTLLQNNTLKFDIEFINYTDSPDGHLFQKNDSINIDNDKVVGKYIQFVNWDAPAFYDETGYFDSSGIAEGDLKKTTSFNIQFRYGVTAGKKCILIKPGNKYTLDNGENGKEWVISNTNYELDETDTNSLFNCTIANIINTSVVPYGGDTETSKNNSVFYSFGDYQDYSADPDSPHYHGIASQATIETTNGDCYICNFVYNSAHCWESGTYKASMYPTVYIFPVESSINLKASYGDLYTRMDSIYKYWFQDKAGQIGKLTQEKDAYLCNTVYNGSYDLISYTPISYTSISNDKFDCRVHYSQIKTNGEYIDNWLKFKAADFIDVDTRYGEITDMNLFKDSLIFWQNKATGVLSVNERTMLQDVNDTNIILGNGDVLQRYDYLTTEYGMKSGQKARTQSNNALYWWDEYNKEILQYPGGNQVLPLKKIKTVSSYVNNIIESESPCLEYDPKYSEVLMSVEKDVDNHRVLVYNEYIQQFTGLYNYPFDLSTKLPEQILLIKNNNLYKWNAGHYQNKPVLQYVVNKMSTVTKVYDNVEFGMGEVFYNDSEKRSDLKFNFHTPLGQNTYINKNITNREYDLKFAVPRNRDGYGNEMPYGDRMRGRTMRCEISSTDINQYRNFSLQYIITKYRISHS